MNIIKKLLLAATFAASIGGAASASAITINSPVNSGDVYLSSANGQVSSTSFDLSITGFINGFVVGVDTLTSALLNITFRDDQAGDNETYKVTLGSGSSTQNFTGNDLNDQWIWTGFFQGRFVPGSVTEQIALNSTALADLRTDGIIKVTVTANSGDFYFDNAYLEANVTRGTVGGGSTSVPEPTTVALLGLGLLGVAAARRKAAKRTGA